MGAQAGDGVMDSPAGDTRNSEPVRPVRLAGRATGVRLTSELESGWRGSMSFAGDTRNSEPVRPVPPRRPSHREFY